MNPDRGLYGTQQTKNFFTHVDNVSLALEDRIKLTSNFALIGGIRFEDIRLARTAFDVDGVLRSAAGYPFSTSFTPVTGRVGFGSGGQVAVPLRPGTAGPPVTAARSSA